MSRGFAEPLRKNDTSRLAASGGRPRASVVRPPPTPHKPLHDLVAGVACGKDHDRTGTHIDLPARQIFGIYSVMLASI